MSSESFESYIQDLIRKGQILKNEAMSSHTTFRVGGPADYFIRPGDTEELQSLIKYLNLVGRDYFILGNGSNLLVGDQGYRGIIIEVSSLLSGVGVNGNIIRAMAGTPIIQVAQAALKHSLTGLEFAAGIPGTVGGALRMNAGAYDGEMKDVVKQATVIATDGDTLTLSNRDLKFDYRKSVLQNGKFVVQDVTFELESGDAAAIKAKMKDFNGRRQDKQPLNFPSAGSTFKRPQGYFAGKLIMDAGLSGYQIGGAKVSEKHCGFVVNAGNATAADVRDLITEVQEKVYDRFRVHLEPEVLMIGEF